jgi:hypothetical protein
MQCKGELIRSQELVAEGLGASAEGRSSERLNDVKRLPCRV